ncbi:WSC domain-containing protein [Rhypophila decipiens]|uniref:WSC domain-containing protein n=1 Tax=Rhypophila decipiens TaxID=261697 RepID=A0AAN6YAD1_9PEZI|nr:WSC domain-containing protein [Rhypophila decipiens]
MISIMTIQVCQAFCAVYPYYGLEYFHECYCGTTPNPAAVKVTPDATYCTTSCDGNSTQKCGGAGYMSLYNDPSVPGPNDPPVFDNSNLVACYQEMASGQARVLDSPFSAQSDSMSLQYCSDYCRSHNLPYWGLEYANQCYCSAAITANSVVRPQSECNLGCAGNEGQLCGGNDRVIVYHRNS